MRNAFSLLELTITVLVIGVLASAAAPSYISAIRSHRLDLATRRIAADIQFAEAEAIRTNSDVRVRYEPAQERYAVYTVDTVGVETKFLSVELSQAYPGVTLQTVDAGGDEVLDIDIYGHPDSDIQVVLAVASEIRTLEVASNGAAQTL